MKIIAHNYKDKKLAEVISDEILIQNIDDALVLLGDLYYQGYDLIVVDESNLTPQFFNLKTKLAGEILQKFTQYQMRLVIVGDFKKYNSNSLQDFIYESNKGTQVNFVQNKNKFIEP
ncbi:DUF4180 domain-containing protein [Sphingobacterium bovistauri]|uniref:DUF4180 domain-containing protein n=1 Tax=Sphingobacterium bovistauri TaxID=2781959 RepID=A0ABS7Z489_9SPHI|nr:DUF4180 domain-containing protein [Sphingobacterium bovistauri]MCA5003584.1 DUF4180 domain-containing protein [Sphingobacterium bovistauri]